MPDYRKVREARVHNMGELKCIEEFDPMVHGVTLWDMDTALALVAC